MKEKCKKTTATRKTDKGRKEQVGWNLQWKGEFKLGLLQLIWKAFLIFKSNLELALSIILKGRELYESEHVAVECRCLKIWHF